MKSIEQLKTERAALDLQIQQAINLERGQAIAKDAAEPARLAS